MGLDKGSILMPKSYVFIMSSMRSGSTLLKALLATKSDVSDLPEVAFDRYSDVAKTTDAKIVVLKSPAYYFNFYPILPKDVNIKNIVLVRHPYETIISLHKMNLETNIKLALEMGEVQLLNYWVKTYSKIMECLKQYDSKEIFVLKYETLVENPISVTSQLFRFVGCSSDTGIDSYRLPENYEWEWGHDDGGDVIKSLSVQNRKTKRINTRLLEMINSNSEAKELLTEFGYDCP